MKKLVLILAALLSLAQLQAQEKVLGLVVEKDGENKEIPLEGASVFWLGTTEGTSTGSNGVFLLKRSENSNRLVISYIGFVSDTVTVTTQKNVKVVLQADDVLNEVVVKGWKPSSGISYLKGINTIEMNEDELFKAACCNLSESFETNPSVDVSFTDAVTGTRQIQMLGLSGSNVLISTENMPGIRGIAANYGLSFIPGTWISSIQVTKGVGSVVNGYESIAGQINVELKKPQDSEKLYLNGYINGSGRTEMNLITSQVVSKKLATTTLLHGSARPLENDRNKDDFLDFPKSNHINLINRWVYKGSNGWLGQFGVKFLNDSKLGGQTNFDPDQLRSAANPYGVKIHNRRYEGFGKLGYVFKNKKYKSFGMQLSTVKHEQDSYFGLNNYDADQNYFYYNFIYQSIIGTTQHKYKLGASYFYDDYDEMLNNQRFQRSESVPGIFAEYTYENFKNLTIISGLRLDQNNLFGTIFTPRLHIRYNPWEATTLRLSGGRGTRTANIIAENTAVLASSRRISFENIQNNKGYGYNQDRAWNFGANLSHDFNLNYRDGVINIDFYHTKFDNQVILDLDGNPQEAVFSSLIGDSFSNSFQTQIDYEPIRRLDVRLAYRWLDVTVDYDRGRLQKPLTANHRAFFNTEYKTKNNWSFDFTLQWTGSQRIPFTDSSPEPFQRESRSKSFTILNTQISKSLSQRTDVYLGVENLTNFRQDNPIISANDPFGPYFDSSLVWGPIFGRMVYTGFRYRVR